MNDRRLRHAYDVDDLRRLARRRLPRAVFEVIEGGTGDEVTVRRNREAFARIALRPRALVDVAKVDTATTILGEAVSMPLMLAPCSFARMCHSVAEPAVARAASRAGTVYAIPTGSSEPLERVAATGGPTWFQLYLNPEHRVTAALLDRVEAAGCRTLCVTIDTAIKPYRERELRNRISMPLKPSAQLLMTGVSRPGWAKDFLLGRSATTGASRLATAGARLNPLNRHRPIPSVTSAGASLEHFADAIRHVKSVTVDDIGYLRERWAGPLVVKGILRHEEVPRLVDLGVDGLVVSNHGGRNLDGTPATIDVLGEVVEAAAGRAEVYLDSGVRRGADVVKAVALGAQAVLIGRPYLYGLAAAGEAGVDKVLQLLRDEVARAMSALGATTVDEIDASLVCRAR